MELNTHSLFLKGSFVFAVGAAAEAMGVPVIETIKNLPSCWDGYGLHCR